MLRKFLTVSAHREFQNRCNVAIIMHFTRTSAISMGLMYRVYQLLQKHAILYINGSPTHGAMYWYGNGSENLSAPLCWCESISYVSFVMGYTKCLSFAVLLDENYYVSSSS